MATPVGHDPISNQAKKVSDALVLREGLSRREFRRRQGLCLASIHGSVRQGGRDIHPLNFLAAYLSPAATVIYDTVMDHPEERKRWKITGPSHDSAYFYDGNVLYLPEEPYGPPHRGLFRRVVASTGSREAKNDGEESVPRIVALSVTPLRQGDYVPSFTEFGDAVDKLSRVSMRRIIEAMRMGREITTRRFLSHLGDSLIHELDSTTATNQLEHALPGEEESLTTYAQRLNELIQQAHPDTTESSRTSMIIAKLKSTVPAFLQKYATAGGEFQISLEAGIKEFKELTRRTAHFDAIDAELKLAQTSAVRKAEKAAGRNMREKDKKHFLSRLESIGEHQAIMQYALYSQRSKQREEVNNVRVNVKKRFIPYLEDPELKRLGIPRDKYMESRSAEREERRAAGNLLRGQGQRVQLLTPEEARDKILKQTKYGPANGQRNEKSESQGDVPLYYVDVHTDGGTTRHQEDIFTVARLEFDISSAQNSVREPGEVVYMPFHATPRQKKPLVYAKIGPKHMKILVDSGCSLTAIMCSATADGIRSCHPELVINYNEWDRNRSERTALFGVDGKMRSYIKGTITLRHHMWVDEDKTVPFTVIYSILGIRRGPSRFRTIWGVPMILAHGLQFKLRDQTVQVWAKTNTTRREQALETVASVNPIPSSSQVTSLEPVPREAASDEDTVDLDAESTSAAKTEVSTTESPPVDAGATKAGMQRDEA